MWVVFVWFVCFSFWLVIPVSSREMHNYVILSMTATIVMMRAAMEQKNLLKGVWIPPLKNISLSSPKQSVSFLAGLLSSFLLSMSPCAAHPPNVFLDGVYLHRSSFSKESQAVPLASQWRDRRSRCLYIHLLLLLHYVVWLCFTTSC